MSFRIQSLTLENFGAFPSAKVEFGAGLTLLEGCVSKHSGRSSGAGKSTILEAIPWVLYGRTLREKWGGSSIVHRGAKSAAATVEIALPGARTLAATRFRDDPEHANALFLWVDDKNVTAGTNAETESLIATHLGMDFTTFVNVIMYGAREDIRSFFASPDSAKKEVLENLLGLGIYAEAGAYAHSLAEESKAALGEAKAARANAEASVGSWQRVLEDLDRRGGVAQAEKVLAALVPPKAVDYGPKIAVAEEILAVAQEKARAAAAAYAQALEQYQGKVSARAKAVATAQAQIASAEREIKDLDGQLNAVGALTVCPHCRQKVSEKHKAQVGESFAPRRAALVHTAEAHRLDLAALEKEKLSPPTRVDESKAVQDAVAALSKLKADAAVSASAMQSYQASRKAAEAQVAAARAQVSHAQESLKTAQESTLLAAEAEAEAQRAFDVDSFWVASFGNSGIKSFLIEAELAEINKSAMKYAQRLLGPGAKVWLTATRELKSKKGSKEEIYAHAVIPGMADSYYAASKGQKRRMDICMLLAFRDFSVRRSGAGSAQLFVDEVFDGLDQVGCEAVIEIMREMAEQSSVVLVTHNPSLRPAADRVLLVEHDGTAATVDTLL